MEPHVIRQFESDYVAALNAILASSDESSDVNRWRGHAEAYRQVCEYLRQYAGMAPVAYTSSEWRRANGVYQAGYLRTLRGVR